MAEGAALEMLCTPKVYRGFESPPLRQIAFSGISQPSAALGRAAYARTLAACLRFRRPQSRRIALAFSVISGVVTAAAQERTERALGGASRRES